MDVIKRHPIPFAVLGFLVITLPDVVENWLSLGERFKQAEGIVWQLIISDWVFPILGLILLIVVIRQRGGVKPTITFEDQMPSWLGQILDDDKTNIGSRIYDRDYIWDFKKLTEPDPYIDLVFTIINASVFAINFTGITGRFLIEDHECAQEAEFTGSQRLPHGERQNIRIRQRLTRDMADLIIDRRNLVPTSRMDAAKKGKVNISLKSCHLTINSEIEGEPLKTFLLAIGGDYEVSVP